MQKLARALADDPHQFQVHSPSRAYYRGVAITIAPPVPLPAELDDDLIVLRQRDLTAEREVTGRSLPPFHWDDVPHPWSERTHDRLLTLDYVYEYIEELIIHGEIHRARPTVTDAQKIEVNYLLLRPTADALWKRGGEKAVAELCSELELNAIERVDKQFMEMYEFLEDKMDEVRENYQKAKLRSVNNK